MEKKNYVVAIDIGTSEVVIAVGTLAEGGLVNIETIVTEPCEGMLAGLVDNNQMVSESLRRARVRAEQQAGIAITDAYVSISGKFVRCARYTDHVFVDAKDACISQLDVNALSERMRSVKSADGEVIMDHYPITYKGTSGVEMKNPVGCYSPQLSSTYNFILCEHAAKDRLFRVFMSAGIKIRHLYAGAAVVGESVVNSDEKEEGVAVVDIGSGVTDVAVYHGGVLRYIAAIPMGGSVVNSDIRVYAGTIPAKMVEKLKRRYGSAMVDMTPDERIELHSGNRIIKPIQRLNLASVIEARMAEIAEFVWAEIRESGYAKKLAAGIILTGGGSELSHVADLFQRVTGLEVRVACAEMGITSASLEAVSSPSRTLAVSLLLRGAKVGACPVGVLQAATPAKSESNDDVVTTPPAKTETSNVTTGGSTVTASDEVKTQGTSVGGGKATTQDIDDDDWESEGDEVEDDENGKSSSRGFWFKVKTGVKEWFDDAFKPSADTMDEDDPL